MKIAIEAQRLFRPNKHGMDFVALELIREIQKADTENEYFILVKPGNDRCLKDSSNVHIIEINCPSFPLWEQIALPLAVKELKVDILHCTGNTAPVFCNAALVLTLHDIIYLEHHIDANHSLYQMLGWYYRKMIVPHVIPNCKKIITVSNYERLRIIDKLHTNEDQVVTIYNGVDKKFYPHTDNLRITGKYIQDDKFIFFLGNTDPKKNVPRTLKAYSIYRKKSTDPLPLLLADLSTDELQTILSVQKIEEIAPYIVCPGYINNEDLPFIYSQAYAFLYTSLRESFGIPILECMACGTPVVTSNTSAIPEVAGKDAILCDPTDENDIADKLLKLENSTEYYESQKEYGIKQVKLFSWKNSAQKLLSIYHDISNRKL